jgi:hypothetical protein
MASTLPVFPHAIEGAVLNHSEAMNSRAFIVTSATAP